MTGIKAGLDGGWRKGRPGGRGDQDDDVEKNRACGETKGVLCQGL